MKLPGVKKYNYIVVEQICIDKHYRGQRILDSCYTACKNYFNNKCDFTITEIARTNLRSIHAHQKIGFKVISRYVAPDKTNWCIVLWNWKDVN